MWFQLPSPKHHSAPQKGQSFVELSLFLPILLIILAGLIEFGFLTNQYMNLLDGPREAARLATDYTDPFTDPETFYTTLAQEVITTLKPVDLHTKTDDVVISVFGMEGNAVQSRYTPAVDGGNGAQWSLQKYCQSRVNSSLADDTYAVDPSVPYGITCGNAAIADYQSSRFSDNDSINALLDSMPNVPPNSGLVLVELFYSYNQLLNLPWITIFVPNPVPLHTYTIMPMPAAEPNR